MASYGILHMRSILPLWFLLTAVLSSPAVPENGISEADIDLCGCDDECIVVPHSHCCGSSKRAINRKYLARYEEAPDWQSFHDPGLCAMIGVCRDDSRVESAVCRDDGRGARRCMLNWDDAAAAVRP